jgi:hypothetical protein
MERSEAVEWRPGVAQRRNDADESSDSAFAGFAGDAHVLDRRLWRRTESDHCPHRRAERDHGHPD